MFETNSTEYAHNTTDSSKNKMKQYSNIEIAKCLIRTARYQKWKMNCESNLSRTISFIRAVRYLYLPTVRNARKISRNLPFPETCLHNSRTSQVYPGPTTISARPNGPHALGVSPNTCGKLFIFDWLFLMFVGNYIKEKRHRNVGCRQKCL